MEINATASTSSSAGPTLESENDRDATPRRSTSSERGPRSRPLQRASSDRDQRRLSRTSSQGSSGRPSSVASSSSRGKFAVSASLLSPSLASALGIGVDGGRKHASSFYANAHSASCTSLTGMLASSSASQHRPRASARRDSNTSNSESEDHRRPSLPNALLSAQGRRMSMISISSFDSLPEEDSSIGFSSPPVGASLPASPPTAALMLPPPSLPAHTKNPGVLVSPPTSPTSAAVAAAAAPTTASLSRRTALKRSMTSPSGPGSVVSWDEKMRKRGLVARELLTTERAFVESLRILQDSFYQPLLSRCGGPKGSPNLSGEPPILSRKAIAEIFSNFSDILRLNTELLGRLEERIGGGSEILSEAGAQAAATSTAFPSTATPRRRWDPETDTVGDILVPIAPFLKMYSLYVKNFSSAIARIETERKENETFARFLKDTERSTWGRGKAFFGLGLQAHLLTVVQRIPRYTLLIADLLKSTPSGHPDHLDLKRAYEMVERVASSINENVRQHEMDMLMLSLQRSLTGLTSPLIAPGRTLLKRGTLLKACRKDIQPRAFFLFTDCIIYARPSGNGGMAAIEATWNAIARAGGGSEIAGPWTPRASLDPTLPETSLQGRNRVSSGNLFSSAAILDALQSAAASSQPQQLQFRDKFPLQDVTVISVEDSQAAMGVDFNGTPWPFEIRTPDKSFAVYADSPQARQEWMTAIREARNDWLQARRTLKTEEDSVEAKRDRRRSVAAAAAAAKARQSVYSMALPGNPSIPEGHEGYEGGEESRRASLADTESASERGGGGDATTDSSRVSWPTTAASPSSRDIAGGNRAPRPSLTSTTSFVALLGGENAASASTTPLRVIEDYNAPAWVPDSRADRCMACTEAFGMWRRKHHCRLCGRVVCWSCSTRKFLIPSYEDGKEDTVARACDSCYESAFPDEEEQDADVTGVTAGHDGVEEESTGAGDSSVNAPSSEDTRFSFPRAADLSRSSSNARDDSNEVTPCALEVKVHNATYEGGGQQTGSDATVMPSRDEGELSNDTTDGLPLSLRGLALSESSKHNAPAQAQTGLPWPSKPAQSLTREQAASSAMSPPSAARIMIAKSHQSPQTATLMPPVQAATSGAGTFRLSAPRITTPEGEHSPSLSTPIDAVISADPAWYGCNVAASASQRSLVLGGEGDYFGEGAIHEEHHGVSTPNESIEASVETPRSHHARAAGSGVPRRKKPLVSAAARLSAYYGKAAGGGDKHAGGGSAHATPSPLRKVSS